MEMSGNDLVVGAVFTRTRSRASLSITRLDFYRWNSAHHESSHLNHSGWFLLLKICTSWIRTKSLIFYIAHPQIIFFRQTLWAKDPNSQFFPLQVPFSPKFEADFWPDERLEQASILVTLLFSGSVLMILLFRQTVGKETLNPLAAVLSPLLTFRYCRPYKDSHLIKSSSKFNFSNLQEIL